MSYCSTVQLELTIRLTQLLTTRPSRPPHRLAYPWGLCNIQVARIME